MPRTVVTALVLSIGALSIGALSTAFAPSRAAAQVSPYVGIGLGPAIRIDDWPNQVRVEQEIGITFGGRDGFLLAFAPYQSWGSDFWVLAFPVRLGGIFSVYHSRDFRFQIGGSGTLGFAISDEFDSRTDPDPWFHFSVGLLLRAIVLQDKLAFYIRPVTFEFGFGDSNRAGWGNEVIRYVAVGGVQYYF